MESFPNITLDNFDSVAYLGNLHTKQLLRVLKACRSCGGFYSPFDSSNGVTFEEVKGELAKREHIPNKKSQKNKTRKSKKEVV